MSQFITGAGEDLLPPAVEKALLATPPLSQDGKALDTKVIARYFVGNYTCYLLENGCEREIDEAGLAFGMVKIGSNEFEMGDISLRDIADLAVPISIQPFGRLAARVYPERDRSVVPLKMTLGECMKMNGEEIPQWLVAVQKRRDELKAKAKEQAVADTPAKTVGRSR